MSFKSWKYLKKLKLYLGDNILLHILNMIEFDYLIKKVSHAIFFYSVTHYLYNSFKYEKEDKRTKQKVLYYHTYSKKFQKLLGHSVHKVNYNLNKTHLNINLSYAVS